MRTMDIQLLRELLRYDPETGKLYWLHRTLKHCPDEVRLRQWNTCYAGKEAFTYRMKAEGYFQGAVLCQSLLAHRVIWALVHGEWPNFIDHVSGDRSDNRLTNLRSVSRKENQRNHKRHSNNTSGTTGVYWSERHKQWKAQIAVDGEVKHLGSFDDKAMAIDARKRAEQQFNFHPNHGRTA